MYRTRAGALAPGGRAYETCTAARDHFIPDASARSALVREHDQDAELQLGPGLEDERAARRPAVLGAGGVGAGPEGQGAHRHQALVAADGLGPLVLLEQLEARLPADLELHPAREPLALGHAEVEDHGPPRGERDRGARRLAGTDLDRRVRIGHRAPVHRAQREI